jgi:transcriptional regulator with XRE-family HTH domain
MQRARKALGLTQRQLGDALGLHGIQSLEWRDELPIVKQTELAMRYLLGKKRKGKTVKWQSRNWHPVCTK